MSDYGIYHDDESATVGQARLLVMGVGGGGGNAVENMVQQGVSGVTFVCANTDRQALDSLTVPNKFQLGAQSTRGLGAGANPEVGRAAAEADEDEIRGVLQEYDMIFITAGMGGGTGTGAAPVIARIAKEMDKLVVAVVTTPFKFEGGKRAKAAKSGIEQLSNYVDSIITIPNEKLQSVYRNLTMSEAFKKANDVLLYGVQGLIQTIRTAGDINVDFNDVRTVMSAKGYAMMGVGRASGDDRARQAAELIRSPLLDDLRSENAQGLLINITAAELMMSEPTEIADIVGGITDLDEGNIFYGFVKDESMGDDIQVTVIATGLSMEERPKVAPSQVYATPKESVQLSAQVQPMTQTTPSVATDGRKYDVDQYLKNQYK